jgi:hypothetical protein
MGQANKNAAFYTPNYHFFKKWAALRNKQVKTPNPKFAGTLLEILPYLMWGLYPFS